MIETTHTDEDVVRADLDFDLWMRLTQARDAIYRLRQKELSRYNLTAEQSLVLVWVHELGDKATPARLSRRMFRKSQSVSELLDRMRRDGLVTKVKDLERRNMVRVVFTERGRAAYSQATKRESIRKAMSQLSDEQRQQLRTCLRILYDSALKELGVKAVPPVELSVDLPAVSGAFAWMTTV